jgi:hypothetical protein
MKQQYSSKAPADPMGPVEPKKEESPSEPKKETPPSKQAPPGKKTPPSATATATMNQVPGQVPGTVFYSGPRNTGQAPTRLPEDEPVPEAPTAARPVVPPGIELGSGRENIVVPPEQAEEQA